MQLTTLVDILRGEIPGIGERPSTRANLARLYTEHGRHDDAVLELRGARRAMRQQSEGDPQDDLEASVEFAVSLAKAGRIEEAKNEAKRILRSGDVTPEISTKLRTILVSGRDRNAR